MVAAMASMSSWIADAAANSHEHFMQHLFSTVAVVLIYLTLNKDQPGKGEASVQAIASMSLILFEQGSIAESRSSGCKNYQSDSSLPAFESEDIS